MANMIQQKILKTSKRKIIWFFILFGLVIIAGMGLFYYFFIYPVPLNFLLGKGREVHRELIKAEGKKWEILFANYDKNTIEQISVKKGRIITAPRYNSLKEILDRENIELFSLSSDGQKIAGIKYDKSKRYHSYLYLINVEDFSEHFIKVLGTIKDLAWSSDNSKIALLVANSGNEYNLKIVKPEENNKIIKVTADVDGYTTFSWSFDSDKIAFVTKEGYIAVANIDGTKVRNIIKGDMPLWLPDGRIIYRHYDGDWLHRITLVENGGYEHNYAPGRKYYIIDPDKKENNLFFDGEKLGIWGKMETSPDGKFVLMRRPYYLLDYFGEIIYVIKIDNKQITKIARMSASGKIFWIKSHKKINNQTKNNTNISDDTLAINKVFSDFLSAEARCDIDTAVNLITKKSKKIVNFTCSNMNAERKCYVGRPYKIKHNQNSGVLYILPFSHKIENPFFFTKENGEWKIDLYKMSNGLTMLGSGCDSGWAWSNINLKNEFCSYFNKNECPDN
jgi:hypothetical protein